MADDDDDTGSTGGKTFTQAEVDKLVRDRLTRERGKYADYDDLKARAAEADKGKTQLDKIEAQLAEMTKQAEKSAREVLIRDVADELKISVKQAKRLSGTTREELLADGREFLEEFKPAQRKSTNDGDANGDGDDDDSSDDDDDKGSSDNGRQAEPPQRRSRPRENLRSGAPMTGGKPEETNPLKLAELIPRG